MWRRLIWEALTPWRLWGYSKLSATAGLLWRHVQGLRICCKGGSSWFNWLTSWWWLLAGDLRISPPRLLSWFLEHGHNMAAPGPENEWWELKIEAMVSFAIEPQKSHFVTLMTSHPLKRVTNCSRCSAQQKNEAAPSEKRNVREFVDIF